MVVLNILSSLPGYRLPSILLMVRFGGWKEFFQPYSNWAGEKAQEKQMAIYDKKAKNCFKVSTGHIKNDLTPGLP